jgi:hypothetical protein
MYLGLRLNPTTEKQGAAINSLELGYQYMELAKEALVDHYGDVDLFLHQFYCPNEYMASIVDTDSRTLANFLHGHPIKPRSTSPEKTGIVDKIRDVFKG